MFSPGMSRPFGIGAVAAQGVMPFVVAPTYILIFLLTDASSVSRVGWVLPAIVAVNVTVQLLAIIGAVGMYWIPRLVHLQRLDGYRVQTTGKAMLAYLALFPPPVAAVGLAYVGGDMQWWHFVLGGASWVVVIPALVDLALRAVLGTEAPPEPGPERLGSGPVGDLLPAGDFDLSIPRAWVALPQQAASGWAQHAAAELSTIPGRRDQVAERLERVQPELTSQHHLMVAVWAPQQASPELAGTLTVDRIVPPAGQRVDRDDYRLLIEPDHRRKVTVFARYIDDIDVPAGPALLVTEVLTQSTSRWRPWDKLAIKNLIYTVFPQGCSEALQLAFNTTHAGVLDEALQLDADATIDTLTVSLGEVRSA